MLLFAPTLAADVFNQYGDIVQNDQCKPIQLQGI